MTLTEPFDPAAINAHSEWCRTCADSGTRTQADPIVWGKLFPKTALGPRCVQHFGEQTGYSVFDHSLGQSAVFDLRSGRVLAAAQEREQRVRADAWDEGQQAEFNAGGRRWAPSNPYRAALAGEGA